MKFFFLSFLVLFFGCNVEKPPIAQKGVLDLQTWNPTQIRSLKLDGEWEFYPSEFLNSFTDKKPTFVSVPHSFSDSEDGFATYRLQIDLPESLSGKTFGVRVPGEGIEYKFFLNGKEILSCGKVGTSASESIPFNKPSTASFQLNPGKNEFVLWVSNYKFRSGGFLYSIEFGTQQEIDSIVKRNLSFDLFLFGTVLIMGVYHLGLFALRRNDFSPLYFGFHCLVVGIRTLITGENYLLDVFPAIDWDLHMRLEYISFFFAVSSFAYFISEIYRKEFKRIIANLLLFSSLAYSLFVMVVGPKLFSKALVGFQIITVLGIVYAIVAALRALFKKREGSKVIFVGMIVLFLTTINDMLNGRVIHTGYIAPLGLFFFIFSQSFLLSLRFSKAFKSNEELSRKLMSLDKLKDESLANTSHELRTPLNGIIGIAESLLDGAAGKMNPILKENVELISMSGKRLSNLVNDILDFSKLKNYDIVLSKKWISIYRISETVVAITKNLNSNKNVVIRSAINNTFPKIWADEDRLEQVLFNLVGNAVKFTKEGSVTIAGEETPTEILIKVIDTGIGIPKKKFETIFQSFEQVDASTTRKYGGTGLGLSISKQLVELHGGTIGVESELEKGSTFTISLPKEDGEGEETSEDSKEISKNVSRFDSTEQTEDMQSEVFVTNVTALIVDDEPVNVKVLSNLLKLKGIQILEASNGQEALDILESGKVPDIVLLDVMMPELSGYDVCEILRKKYTLYELPILILTAKNQIADLVKGLEFGANDYLTKPFDKVELMARVNTLVALKQAAKNHDQFKALQQELSIARNIQRSLLPESFPKLSAVHFFAHYSPYQQVGGDFYDTIVENDSSFGVIMADVSGHGIPAAFIASMLKIVFSVQTHLVSSPSKLLGGINQALVGKLKKHYITASYVHVDTKEKLIRVSSAGHPSPFLWKKKAQKLVTLETRGRILGWIPDSQFTEIEEEISSGDKLILYSDGITEVRNAQGELFGETRLAELLEKTSDQSPKQIVEKVLQELNNFSGVYSDDKTMLVVEFLI